MQLKERWMDGWMRRRKPFLPSVVDVVKIVVLVCFAGLSKCIGFPDQLTRVERDRIIVQ